jgi:hypothetical protein
MNRNRGWVFVLWIMLTSSGADAAPSACNADYPALQEPRQLFYLQRTGNSNTVVYAAKLGENRKIDGREPVEVYWRWLARNGEKTELGMLERMLAFGVEHQPVEGAPDRYLANLVSYRERKVVVEQTADGRPRARMEIAGEEAQLDCIYVEWRELAGIIPQVLYVDIVGRSLDGKRKVRERLVP